MTGFGMYDTGWLRAAAVAGCSFVMTAPVGAVMRTATITDKIMVAVAAMRAFFCLCFLFTLSR